MAYVERDLPGELTEEQVREHFVEWRRDETDFRIASGIEFPVEHFASAQQGADWLKINTQSWGAALAVRINTPRQDTGNVKVAGKSGTFDYRVVSGWNANPVVYVQIPEQKRERRLRPGGERAVAVIKEYRRVFADTGRNIWLVGVWSPS